MKIVTNLKPETQQCITSYTLFNLLINVWHVDSVQVLCHQCATY